MSVIVGLSVFACAAACAVSWCLWMERRDQRAEAAQPRKPIGARYVDVPGFPRPADPTPEQIAEYEIDDAIPMGDIWTAYYPPGSLGQHPETTSWPGPLTADPKAVEDLLTGALRLLRAEADDTWRITPE